jgi:hypothetical protein
MTNFFRPTEFWREFVCDTIHVTPEIVGNVTKMHFDVLIKEADGTEQITEGRGRAFKPKFASTSFMSFRFTKDDILHGKYYTKCLYRTCCLQKSCKLIYYYVLALAPKDFKRLALFHYWISKSFSGIREKGSRRGLMYKNRFFVFIRKITPGSIFQTVNTECVTCHL